MILARARLRLATASLFAASTVVALILGEGVLRGWEHLRTQDRLSLEHGQVPDPRLVFRLAPNAPGHDARGFRNRAVPDQADVVAVGDSQTWGINASAEEAWPQVLERRIRRPVYQLAHGGYGPVQYLALTEEAAVLHPRVVVVGLYFGNDLWDAYRVAYTEEAWRDLRLTSFPADWLDDHVGRRADRLWREEKSFLAHYRGPGLEGWLTWFRGHSALGRLADRLLGKRVGSPWYATGVAWAQAHPDEAAFYAGRKCGTVLTTAYRLTALDLDEPRIAEGLRLTRELLAELHRRVSERGAIATVVLIPTKEAVYASLVQAQQGILSPHYARLVTMEARIRESLLAWCRGAGIAVADSLPPLESALRRGECPYPADTDGHPTAGGYELIAATAELALAKAGVGPRSVEQDGP